MCASFARWRKQRRLFRRELRYSTTTTVSTNPLELAQVCDRVVVFYNGHNCATLDSQNLNAQTILEVMNTW